MMKIKSAQTVEPGLAKPAPPTRPPERILVVDDDPPMRQLITNSLARAGYRVDTAADGALALEALEVRSYDLLITDNHMPRVTGIELVRKLRGNGSVLPVVMATGTLPLEDLERYPELGIRYILIKPFTIEQMLNTVEKVLCGPGDANTNDKSGTPQPNAADMRHRTNILKNGSAIGGTSAKKKTSPNRVLVVDSNSDLLMLYTDALAGPEIQIDVAENSVAAWEALRANAYDLLFTENDVPDRIGDELVTRLRAARMAVPVVIAAGKLSMPESARYHPCPFAATLLKPFNLEVLQNTIKRVLRMPIPAPFAPMS